MIKFQLIVFSAVVIVSKLCWYRTVDILSYTFHLFQIACLPAIISSAFLAASIIIDPYRLIICRAK